MAWGNLKYEADVHLESVAEDPSGNDSNLCLKVFSEDQNRIMTAETEGVS